MKKINFFIVLFLVFSHTSYAQKYYLLVGTYTDNSPSKGIYVYDFNNKTGAAKELSHTEAGNPSYLAISNNGKFVYSVNESAQGKISAFSFDKKSAALQPINSEKNNGIAPCYVALDNTGKWLFAGNYSSGDLTLHPINADGSIGAIKQLIKHDGTGPDKSRQQSPHVHCAYISGNNKFLYVPDLGIDKVMIYPFNAATGMLDEKNNFFYKVEPGGGPRHITFSQNGSFAYLVEELSGAVNVLRQQNGRLINVQKVNELTKGEKGAGADIHLSPDEKFLYVSQRSDNTIQIFKVDKKKGTISYISPQSTLGKTPRNFTISPSGEYLLAANQNTNDVVIFKRNKTTGLLTDEGQRIQVGKPVCLKWVKR